jgi:hypothetical protein
LATSLRGATKDKGSKAAWTQHTRRTTSHCITLTPDLKIMAASRMEDDTVCVPISVTEAAAAPISYERTMLSPRLTRNKSRESESMSG